MHFCFQEHGVLIFAGDKCCFMLCSLHGYSAPALQAVSSAGSSGTPGTSGNPYRRWAPFLSGAGPGREMTTAGLLGFQSQHLLKDTLGSLLKSYPLPSVFLMSITGITIHSVDQAPNLTARLDAFFSLTSHFSQSYHGSLQSVSRRHLLFSIPLFPFLAITSTEFLLLHLLPYNPFSWYQE